MKTPKEPKFLNKIQVGSPFIVKKDQFPYYIRLSDKLPSIIDEEANIEIISPVLKKGNYKWKGIYDSKPIEFYMKDNIFKESIVNQKVEFKNGVAIKCVLEIFRKIDEIGEEQVTHYSVNTVLAQCTNDLIKETEQGKKYKKKKAYAAMQMTFELQ